MEKNDGIVFPIWKFVKSGGMRVVTMFANTLFERGYKVILLAYYETDLPYYPVRCPILYVNDQGIASERIENRDYSGKIALGLSMKRTQKALKRGLDKISENYSTVIANYNMTAMPVYRCKIKHKFYYVQLYETGEIKESNLFKRLHQIEVKRTYKLPLTIIVNSDLYRDFNEIHSKHVVPPGLDLEIYYPRKEYWDGNRQFIIGCIGRKEIVKGSQDVADAVELIYKKDLNVLFKVAFNDVNCSSYELCMPDGDSNLADYYRSVDILVAPGRIQLGAIHYPVIEAMACGTPVITTGYYPASEENSYIVPVAAPEAIAECIDYIYHNYKEAIQKAEKAQGLINQFSWELLTDKLLDIIA